MVEPELIQVFYSSLLLAVIVFGFWLSSKHEGEKHKVILICITLGFILPILQGILGVVISISALIIILIGKVVAVIYGFSAKELPAIERFSIICGCSFSIIYYLVKIMHLPGAALISLIGAVFYVTYLAAVLYKRKLLAKEMSFMAVIICADVITLLEMVFKIGKY